MDLALVDGERRTPPGGRGLCQYCGIAMVARCGRVKMWHWGAHAAIKLRPLVGRRAWLAGLLRGPSPPHAA